MASVPAHLKPITYEDYLEWRREENAQHTLNPYMLDILTSGEFSDVTVICGDKEWQLHRLILACRSFHFRDILTQLVDIEVTSRTKVVLDDEVDPEYFNCLVRYIYGGLEALVTEEAFEDENRLPYSAYRLYCMSSHFRVPNLADNMYEVLEEYFATKGHELITKKSFTESGEPERNQKRLFDDDFLEGFFKGVAHVFGPEDSCIFLQDAYLKLFTESSWMPELNYGFQWRMALYPAFSAYLHIKKSCIFWIPEQIQEACKLDCHTLDQRSEALREKFRGMREPGVVYDPQCEDNLLDTCPDCRSAMKPYMKFGQMPL